MLIIKFLILKKKQYIVIIYLFKTKFIIINAHLSDDINKLVDLSNWLLLYALSNCLNTNNGL